MNKILEIFTYHGGYMGGVATMINSYIEGIEEFKKSSCELTHLNIKPNIDLGFSQLNNLAYIFTQRRAVIKYLKENIVDVVHIHTSREYLFLKDILLARTIRKRYKVPVILTIHVGQIDTVYSRIGWFKNKSLDLLNKYVDKVIFLSKNMSQDFIDAGLEKKRSVVLYNFYRLMDFESLISADRSKLNLLYVGAIHREKGILELLNALNGLEIADYHLNICGEFTDESIKDEVKHLINKLGHKVTFLGYISGKEKADVFNNADLLVLPSYHEGLPLVIMEALGAGCGIMATKVGSIPEILNNENCIWIDVGSVESIKDQLRSLTDSTLMQMKLANKQLAMDYTFEKHVRLLAEIYNDAIL